MRTKDLTGMRFGRLLVIGRDMNEQSKHDYYWRCICDCGNEKSVTTGHLSGGTVSSCGCLRKEQAIVRIKQECAKNVVHGEAGKTALYAIWQSMKQRCKNPKNPGFKWYGAKGVKICQEWQSFAGFAKWAHENGYADLKGVERAQRLSIDRIDSSKDYCPENCRWITVSENTRRGCESRWGNAKRANRSARTKSAI